ncbi:MAG: long-chain-fatty-acid--CoA ligase [Flammeovirgaceae bacterium]|nr:long-chain-fatty-acid--CoA ligase [Flammeovirgaceae bacterium]MBR08568.1 long-chain-fatty-acid--CoA ligase [Rickettsiales bacterium]HCX22308.1 long-chain-fatty-acid--CoA ligase [Cytophagales bacterium]|tara:strand:+ start:1763 stop:3442 length:1680 start_codon:yes stop_codon:yes gene_type:complete
MTEFPWINKYPSKVPKEIDPDKYGSLLDFLDDCVSRFADSPAFENMGVELSFKELDEQSTALANYLSQETSLVKGDRVALQMPNVLQYPIALFGVMKAGMIVVNTNPQYKPSEMEHQFKDAEAKGIIILSTFAFKLEEVMQHTKVTEVIIAEVGDMLGTFKGAVVDFMVKRVKKMVPDYNLPTAINFGDALKRGKKLTYNKPDLQSSDLALLQYTGGTTGVAKGAALSHRNLIANIEQVGTWMSASLVDGKEITITPLPLYHVFALTVNCFGMMRIGAKSVLITDPRKMKDFIKVLKKTPFTVITGINTLFNGLLQQPDFKEVDFSNLKVAVSGGMALQMAVAERWKEVTGNDIVEGYGLSETSPLLTCNPIDGTQKLGTIGLPVPSTEIKIMGEEGDEKSVGEFGEIWAKGPQVMTGYWQNQKETDIVMDGEWFKTGDIAFFDAEGFLKIVDRKKEMVNVSGMKVFPNEVEDVIASMPGVLEVGVIGVPHKTSGEVVKAFIVKKDPKLTEEEILKHCKQHLVAYKMPKHIEFREDLPKSNVGKILRKELRKDEVSNVA